MTNEQIIADIAATIYGEDAVMEMLENGDTSRYIQLKAGMRLASARALSIKCVRVSMASNAVFGKRRRKKLELLRKKKLMSRNL